MHLYDQNFGSVIQNNTFQNNFWPIHGFKLILNFELWDKIMFTSKPTLVETAYKKTLT